MGGIPGAPPDRARLLKEKLAPAGGCDADWGARPSWMGQRVGEWGSEGVELEEICTPGWTLRTTLGLPRSAAHATCETLVCKLIIRSAIRQIWAGSMHVKSLKIQFQRHCLFMLNKCPLQTIHSFREEKNQ